MNLTDFNSNYLNSLLEKISKDQKSVFPLADFNINLIIFFFYQGFLSRTLTTHRTAGEGRGPSFSTLPLPPVHEHSDIYLQLCT